MMKKIVVSMLCLALIAGVFSGCVEEEEEEQLILIGVILPETGALSSIGVDMVKAAQLAADHINAEGGILDGINVSLVVEDSQTTPDQAKLAAQRILAKDVAVIIGAAASSCTLAVATETEPSEVVVISPASTSPELTNNDWIFRVVGDDNLQGTAMIDLTEALDISYIVVFSINNAYGAGIHDVILDEADESEITVVQDSLYEEASESYEPDLTTIKTAVEEGLGTSILSKWAARKELRYGSLKTAVFKEEKFVRDFSVVFKKSKEPSHTIEQFTGFLRRYPFNKLLAS